MKYNIHILMLRRLLLIIFTILLMEEVRISMATFAEYILSENDFIKKIDVMVLEKEKEIMKI